MSVQRYSNTDFISTSDIPSLRIRVAKFGDFDSQVVFFASLTKLELLDQTWDPVFGRDGEKNWSGPFLLSSLLDPNFHAEWIHDHDRRDGGAAAVAQSGFHKIVIIWKWQVGDRNEVRWQPKLIRIIIKRIHWKDYTLIKRKMLRPRTTTEQIRGLTQNLFKMGCSGKKCHG